MSAPWRRWLASTLLVAGCATTSGQTQLVVDPQRTGTLPDGSVVFAVLVVPEANLVKGDAWRQWETSWPTRSCLRSSSCP